MQTVIASIAVCDSLSSRLVTELYRLFRLSSDWVEDPRRCYTCVQHRSEAGFVEFE
jgi:hypothetical protein